ncbi:MAG TPA: D-2-hydroxyacid dehydrogenase [Chloroflexota bacterium]|nr:D-2-hydroxyacid dehydrogenase [Chloroflexota bacterium]
MSQLRVLIGAEPIEEQDRERIRAAFPDVRFTFAESAAEAPAAAPEAEVVFSKSTEALAAAPRLRWFQAGTAGVDRALKVLEGRPEVVLTNARGAHGIPMAENILTMALCFATRMHRLIRTQPQKAKIGREVIAEKWELDGQTMLVLGLGDIGGTLAHKAKALGMRVIGVRRSGEPHPDCERVVTPDRLHEALPEADHVACCLPLTGETRAIIGEPELRLMKRSAHIYNVGRGASIEGVAMRRALTDGWIAGAGLDCVDPTDVPADDDVLWAMENVILSHHTSGSSPYNSRRITDIFLENLGRYVRGEPLMNVVRRELGY